MRIRSLTSHLQNLQQSKSSHRRSGINSYPCPLIRLRIKQNTSSKQAARDPLAPDRIAAILKALDEAYPNADVRPYPSSPWELLVATILSAQCTDVRVNMVTPELFRRFPTPQAMAKATLPQLEELIRTTGFYRNKAKVDSGRGTARSSRTSAAKCRKRWLS